MVVRKNDETKLTLTVLKLISSHFMTGKNKNFHSAKVKRALG